MRKVCVVTGSRADFGHLFWVMKEIQSDPELTLQVIATGSHLSKEHGTTIADVIEHFRVDAFVECLLANDSPVGIAKSLGLGVIGFADAFRNLIPDIVVLLGDRYEMLAAAQAAMVMGFPIAHIHGGEATEGLIDEAIRHSITKMSHLHFVAAKEYGLRVIQLGEDPNRVFNFGAPGFDHLDHAKLMDRYELQNSLGKILHNPIFVVTYHPETLENDPFQKGFDCVLEALNYFQNAQIIFTYPNAEAFGKAISKKMESFANGTCFENLGFRRYLSLLNQASVVIGNSSSGIIEAPLFKVPTVNIGDRQRGRARATSIIDCPCSTYEIVQAVNRALSVDFKHCLTGESPYGRGGASAKIKGVLKTFDLKDILKKRFHNL